MKHRRKSDERAPVAVFILEGGKVHATLFAFRFETGLGLVLGVDPAALPPRGGVRGPVGAIDSA
jgi:hypothetical protein